MMARRRSARLARAATKSPTPKPVAPTLSALTEGDESIYEDAMPSIDTIVSSPAPVPQTPGASSPIKPPVSEMHPSRAHQSMAPPSSGLRLGFTDIKSTAGLNELPAAIQLTPTKIGFRAPSSDFTFRFTRDTTASLLGPEAQRLMEALRNSEETKRIKEELKAQAQLEAEKAQTGEEVDGRKIAKPKGKAGRFSAAHMAEFKKMDSIENHPSAFRAIAGHFPPSGGVKRTQSKAHLTDRDPPLLQVKTGLKRTQSKANLHDGDTPSSKVPMAAVKPAVDRGDGPQSPVKRARQRLDEDASSSRPISRDGSSIPRPKFIPSVAMTPTKASLARAAAAARTPMTSNIKPPSMLSGLKRSATAKTPGSGISTVVGSNVTIRSPSATRSASRTFAKMKSMFRSTPADKSKSLLPMMPGSTASLALDKPLPSLPTATPAKPVKHVVFTPTTKRVLETAQTTPSPLKSGIPKSKARQPLEEVHYPPLDGITGTDDTTGDVQYPDLSVHKAVVKPPSVCKPAIVAPSVPGNFTFRSDKTISFGPVSPSSFGASLGQTSLRQVRPSIAPGATPSFVMPGSFPSSTKVTSTGPDKENEAPAPPCNIPPPSVFKALPHGIITKKRHRVASDEEEAEQEEVERAAKKRRAESVPEGEALLAPRLIPSGKKPTPALTPSAKRVGMASSVAASPSPRKKPGMSLSRLNMLARPKNRK